MIGQALQADVLYAVHFDRAAKLDAQAQLVTLQNLALKLGVEASALTGRTIEAKGIVWGMVDEMYLASLFAPQHLSRVDRRASRLISEQETPTLTTAYDDLRGPTPTDCRSTAAANGARTPTSPRSPPPQGRFEDAVDRTPASPTPSVAGSRKPLPAIPLDEANATGPRHQKPNPPARPLRPENTGPRRSTARRNSIG